MNSALQKCIDNFAVEYEDEQFLFTLIINTLIISQDTRLFSVALKQEVYHILEIDYVESLDSINAIFNKALGRKANLVKVKKKLSSFENSNSYKAADIYQLPDDAEALLPLMNNHSITKEYYVTFMAKGSEKDTINLNSAL